MWLSWGLEGLLVLGAALATVLPALRLWKSLSHKGALMKQRPTSVTVIAWILIVSGAVALVGVAFTLNPERRS